MYYSFVRIYIGPCHGSSSRITILVTSATSRQQMAKLTLKHAINDDMALKQQTKLDLQHLLRLLEQGEK